MLKKIAVLTIAASAAGCAQDDYQRIDGLTMGAGNAIAANTAMQMVDPWPVGVDDTRLRVPADATQYKTKEAAAVDAEKVDSSVDSSSE